MFRSLQNWLNLAVSPAKRSVVPARRRTAHMRVESLESRCMLAASVLTDSDFGYTRAVNDAAVLTTNHTFGLYVPQFNGASETLDGGLIPIPSSPPHFEVRPIEPAGPAVLNPARLKPAPLDLAPLNPAPLDLAPNDSAQIVPAPANSLPIVPSPLNPAPGNLGPSNPAPAIPDTAGAGGNIAGEGAAETDSGFDRWDQETGLENPSDATPLDDPSPRELSSVLQMLAGLKYPVGSAESVADVEGKFNGFVSSDRRLETSLSETDGGPVAIAVSEIADELEAARALPSELEESLLEISVQMDRSAGRFQAFEVLTLEAPVQPASEARPTELQTPSDTGAVNFEASSEAAAVELPAQTSSRQAEVSSQVASVLNSDGSLAVSAAEEKASSTWSLPIALVTFGFVLQLLRDRRAERLRVQAAAIWQSLVAVTFWKPARRQPQAATSRPQ